MPIANFIEWLNSEEVYRSVAALRNMSEVDIGFNAFALASDYYYRENFFSDILAAILDPQGKHGAGDVYLKLFLDFLCAHSPTHRDELIRFKACLDDTAVVSRETDRIDIKISCHRKTIIIENKINGAGDMPRQIPRYIGACTAKDEEVVAVVYLTAAMEGGPSRDSSWTKEDAAMVSRLLISIAGYNDKNNIVSGWLEKCMLATNDFKVMAVLSQFIDIVKHQGGVTMNNEDTQAVLGKLEKSQIKYSELKNMVGRLPSILAKHILDKLQAEPDVVSVFPRLWIYKDTIVVLDDFCVGKSGKIVKFAIDIHCENLKEWGVTLFIRSENETPDVFKDKLAPIGVQLSAEWNNDRYWLLQDESTDLAFADSNAFVSRVVAKIKSLASISEELASCIEVSV